MEFKTGARKAGAGSGNRTRTLSLEGSYDTISPYPLEGFRLYFIGTLTSSREYQFLEFSLDHGMLIRRKEH